MKAGEIRESYLAFFERKGARRVSSSSLIPDDPSLLFTSAGMVPFKPVFLGLKDLGFSRAATCQKCLRTTDIDIIGTTGRHHSFFEMLGNFSFGDYFKSEACAWAHEYSTEVLRLDPERIWYSIFEDDDEAEVIWREEVGVSADRIVRLGAADNFWSAGPTGPCGPCSELYYDQGADVGCGSAECRPGCECDRFLEYWNLVFMQFDRAEDGTLTPLPTRNIDTGMGLERVAAIMQGVRSNFETDDLRAIIAVAEQITATTFGAAERTDVSLRILADHARAITFMIADGVLPSNEGRGYVLRRLLRRAVRHGRLLGTSEPFLTALVDVVVDRMGATYAEIVEHHELVRRIVDAEEVRFGTTLRQGLVFLEEEIEGMRERGEACLSGTTAFTLHDTYGFPIELTAEIVAEAGLDVDMEVFETEMAAQRERARAAAKGESWNSFASAFAGIATSSGETEFVGYAHDEATATVVGIVVGGEGVDSVGEGTQAEVVLNRTPFYPEQGGQVGDTGMIATESGALFEVADTRRPVADTIAHRGAVAAGMLSVGDTVKATIDVARRERIRRNHTATHLVHWALQRVIGDHVKQSGSYVAPDRMRFDFTHFEAPGAEILEKVEHMVNIKLLENHHVRSYETSLTSAREAGVTALFGEKYGEFVRVLEVGNFSKELCGGTHVARTTEIGLVKIVSEGSVGANLRRIEAVTAFDALAYIERDEAELIRVAVALKVPRLDVSERVAGMIKRIKELEAAGERPVERLSESGVEEILASRIDVGYSLVISRLPDTNATGLRAASDMVRERLGRSGAVVLATVDPDGGAPLLLAAGTAEAVAAGFDAGAVIRSISPHVKGGGGGKPMMAQAGGKDASGIDAALQAAREMLGALG